MSSIDNRYIVMGAVLFEGCFNVRDNKEERIICLCSRREDAGMIAGSLNREWEHTQKMADIVEEMGG